MYMSSSLPLSPSTCYGYRCRTVALRVMPMLRHTGHAHVCVVVIVVVLAIAIVIFIVIALSYDGLAINMLSLSLHRCRSRRGH